MTRSSTGGLDVESRASRLRRVAAGVGCQLSEGEVESLDRFSALFATWNEKINLGGARSFAELADEHLVDAFAARQVVGTGERVIDVGSGGGLPALPLACLCEGSSFELWEPRAKRAAFLRTAVRELGLKDRVEVVARRLEAPGPEVGASRPAHACSVAMSRATWPPNEWLANARRVAPSARVLVFTTAAHLMGLERAAQVLAYGRDRRLAVFPPSS